jgi:predicted HTH transcriptional regulator
MNQSDHPFTRMNDIEILKSCGFYVKDPASGNDALTLGGILVFGNERLIQSALPHHRTDALLRRRNLDRYDDRDDIRENLIKSYERMTHFVTKHLDDRFHLIGDQRVNLRDAIYREAITNSLIHREYANPFPAKMIIYSDRVVFENSSKLMVMVNSISRILRHIQRIRELLNSSKKLGLWMNLGLVFVISFFITESMLVLIQNLSKGISLRRSFL